MTHTITFPPPARLMTLNQRHDWRTNARLIRVWRRASTIAALQQLAGLTEPQAVAAVYRRWDLKQRDALTPHRIALPPSIITCTLPVADRRTRDPHNYFPTVKAIVDGIADCITWPSDGPDWVTTVEPHLVVRAPHVTVELAARQPKEHP